MSIEQTNVVDLIGINEEEAVLIISDHLDWEDEFTHLTLLQDKINCYLDFVESGEIYESYPGAKGLTSIIEIAGCCDLSDNAQKFYQVATKMVEEAGLHLRFRKI